MSNLHLAIRWIGASISNQEHGNLMDWERMTDRAQYDESMHIYFPIAWLLGENEAKEILVKKFKEAIEREDIVALYISEEEKDK